MGSMPVIRLAVTGGVRLMPRENRMYAPPTCTAPRAKTAAKVGAEKSVSPKHRGVSSTPAVSWPKKQEEMASAFSPVFIMNTPA